VIVSSEPQRKILSFGLRLSGLRTQAPDCAMTGAAAQAASESRTPAPQKYAAGRVCSDAMMKLPRLFGERDCSRTRTYRGQSQRGTGEH
jgi:hypothetical protein